MDPKITIPIAVVISVIATMGVMMVVPLEFNSQSQMPVTEFDDQPQMPVTESVYVDKTSSKMFKGTNDVKAITSQEELKDILEAASSFDDDNVYRNKMVRTTMSEDFMLSDAMDMSASEPAMASASPKRESSGGSEYSTTNVQVENVDEPDYLKNDSKYVYIVSQNKLSIIDAYPAESAELILKIALDIESQYIQNMFLNGDRLVIFYNGEGDDEVIPQYDFIPRRSFNPITHALIIDVTDKENPTIVKDYSIDGHFMDARMIGDYAYFVTNSGVDYQHPRLPIIMEDSVRIMTSDAFYFDNAERFSSFNTITAIDIFGDGISSESFLMGYSGTFYVSEDNFYLTYQQNMPFGFYENSSQDRFFDVIVPLLPKNIQEQIKEIQNDSTINATAQWMKISELLQEFYNRMDKNDKERLFEMISGALNEYDVKIQEERMKTIIHKISIDDDNIEYVAKGSVPGRLLNQFSMDENGDRFRVATTSEYYIQHQGTVRANAVYVLDEQLDIVGELEKIAPDESIFSARFMGDRLYLVTFEQIDPFFVIDLSSDTPKILGELKIPGFSNYLHPYDDEHVIGIGRDTKVVNRGVQQMGIKIALFNVADVNNPKVQDDIVIGDGSTYSESLHDHKAFFFDKTSGILSIPISGDSKSLKSFELNSDRWNGFYVFSLDSTEGFDIKGKIAHFADDHRYYGMGNARTFYIDTVLYTASEKYLKMNDLDSIKEINSIKLENSGKFIDYIAE